jgi:sialic acid synthase
MAYPYVIAEIGCNHRGDLDTALEMIRVAHYYANADAVKFQKRNPRELLTPEQYDAPHPNPANAYGATYGEHREFLEFSVDEHRELKAYADSIGIVYSSSVWDCTSAREIASLEPAFIKVPSACNANEALLDWLFGNYPGMIHVSTGMSTHAEIDALIERAARAGRAKDIVLYHCVSGYPVDFDDCCLLEIRRLRQAYGDTVAGIGFSGHHLGIAVDVAAFTLGAACIERHFTLNRSWKGTDHAASLEPDGLRKLARDLRATAEALRWKPEEILPVERAQREKLKSARRPGVLA